MFSNDNDYIFEREKIKDIQTTELSEIQSLSIEELSTRVNLYQRTSRELYLKTQTAYSELSRRLSEANSTELEAMIEKVPAAERHLVERNGFKKPKAPTVVEKRKANIKSAAKTNPAIAAMLKDLGAKL